MGDPKRPTFHSIPHIRPAAFVPHDVHGARGQREKGPKEIPVKKYLQPRESLPHPAGHKNGGETEHKKGMPAKNQLLQPALFFSQAPVRFVRLFQRETKFS